MNEGLETGLYAASRNYRDQAFTGGRWKGLLPRRIRGVQDSNYERPIPLSSDENRESERTESRSGSVFAYTI
jgi:hypothetical protein